MTATLTSKKFYSFDDYLVYDDDTDNRYELVDGELIVMNPPTVKHNLIADFIHDAFKAEIKRLGLAWVSFREAGVRTSLYRSRLTDVCVVPVEVAKELINESAIFQHPPLLAVEVVSPESVKRDYRYKRSEYAALGIAEYWIVDPLENKVSLLIWQEGLYEETIFTADQQIISPTFSELSLTVEAILAAGNIG